MTEQQQVLAEIEAGLRALSVNDQAHINTVAGAIRLLVQCNGAQGKMALALVGAEMAASDEG